MALRWESHSNGNIPRDAVSGGWDAQGNEPLFVGRATHNGTLCVGKVHRSHGCCYVPFGDKEYSYRNYEVLVNPGNCVHLEWEHCRQGSVANNAVEGGKNPEGESYFIGRHSHKGDTLCGKIHTRHQCLYVSYGGGSVKKPEYECLVIQRY